MLVFGDAVRVENPAVKLLTIRRYVRDADTSVGIVRHGLLVAALIEAGELVQGLADRTFEARGGRDIVDHPAAHSAMALAVALARGVLASWNSDFRLGRPEGPDEVEAALTRLGQAPLPAEVACRMPEGFAFYALYPECFAEAAEALPPSPEVTVVGIRSIGTTLSAMVSAALGAPPPFTVRPVGHPFRRELELAPSLRVAIGARASAAFAVVDEGPGLSGSSMAAVARGLVGLGAEPQLVHLMPGHSGPPGPEATEDVRAIWDRHPRHVRTFDDVFLRSPHVARRLEHWTADLIGLPLAPLHDISAGAWRARRFAETNIWPPVHAWGERRKFIAETAYGTWLLKFAGLGAVGLAKAKRASALAEAGFTPEAAGWRHGFLAERWEEDARSLSQAATQGSEFIRHLGRYLGFRARAFPARPDQGASVSRLIEMTARNVEQALGPDLARDIESRLRRRERSGLRAKPVEVDGRLHAWEWLVLPDGRLLKADALDHHAGHDLVGCQDIAWDIAGASVELSLPDETIELLGVVIEAESGRSISPELVQLMMPLYAAFQLGAWSLARDGASDAERPRVSALVSSYGRFLAQWPEVDARTF